MGAEWRHGRGEVTWVGSDGLVDLEAWDWRGRPGATEGYPWRASALRDGRLAALEEGTAATLAAAQAAAEDAVPRVRRALAVLRG